MSDRMKVSPEVMAKASLETSAQLAYITWGSYLQPASLQALKQLTGIEPPATKEELAEAIAALWLARGIAASRKQAFQLLNHRSMVQE